MDLIGDDCMVRKILKCLICSKVFFGKRTSASEMSMNANEYISAVKNNDKDVMLIICY